MFLKNKNIIFKIRRSKVTDYAALKHTSFRPPDKSVYQKIIFLTSQPKQMFRVLKEPPQWDGSFEHPKHMFKLMGKKIITILR